MATAFEGRFTPQEYLARERASRDSKCEYVNGRIYAMGGASLSHSQIASNVVGELTSQMRGGPCRTVFNDMRVKVPRTEMYTYPDVVVFCGEPMLEDDHFDTLLNPTVIIEVLSPSTERYDRGDKWAHFRQLETLQTYVLVSQDEMRVETFTRRGDEWIYSEASGAEGVLDLPAVGCSVPLNAIYEHVLTGGAPG
ncbi:MAG TPA: Uma2 family endonuclease [Longimicrobium sp.]|jgi:Uma2 family endonuclease